MKKKIMYNNKNIIVINKVKIRIKKISVPIVIINNLAVKRIINFKAKCNSSKKILIKIIISLYNKNRIFKLTMLTEQ